MLHYQQYHQPQLIPKQLPPFQRVITPLPLRGGAGGEALFAFYINDICIITPHVYSCFLAALAVDCLLKPVKEGSVFRELLFCFLMNYV